MAERYEKIKDTVITLVGSVAAAVSMECPIIALFDPAICQIAGEIIEYFHGKTEKPEGFDSDLQNCLKNTIENMMERAPNRTIESTLRDIQPTLEHRFSQGGQSEFDYEKLVDEIKTTVNKEFRHGEVWLSVDEIYYINNVFLEEFGAQLYKYPALQGNLVFRTVLQQEKKIDDIDQEIQRLREKIQYLEQVLKGKAVGEEELAKILLDAYQDEQLNNPRFQADQVSSTLLPQLLSATLVKSDVRCPMPIGDFFQMYWNNKVQRHISLTGIGGIGKTTALLATEYSMPVVYVPLRNLADCKIGETEFIEKYIREITLGNQKEAFDAFIGFCHQKWNDGPRVVILLDGINEVEGGKRSSIFDEIAHKWLRKPGLQLIITSRYDIRNDLVRSQCDSKFTHAQIQPLPRTVVETYLKEQDIRSNMTSQIWNIINTPLMLMLYIRGEKAKGDYGSVSLNWREPKNSGSIIWNYLLSEVVKLNNAEFGNGVFSLFLMAPYICYRMMRDKVFSVTSDVFETYLQDAMTYYKGVLANDKLPTNIRTELNRADANVDLPNMKSYSLVVQKFGIFFEYQDTVKITHQHLRDCLAAIHIIHTADQEGEIPAEWTEPFDVHVMEFIANLLETETKRTGQRTTWQKVWGFAHQKGKNQDIFVQTMLEIYQRAYGMDLSEVDFSGVDLQNISLVPYRLSSKSQNHFKGTVLSRRTFFGDGHADQVSGVSWSQDEQYYMSASYDCTIRLYRNLDHTIMEQLQARQMHNRYIRCAEFAPTAEERIASAGDDKELIVWHKECENWKGRVWGRLGGWIRRLAWDPSGTKVVCGDGDGCIVLFTGGGKQKTFSDRHNGNVTALAWTAGMEGILASGGQDGYIMIWDAEGNCKSRLRLDASVVSLGWLHDDTLLLAATAKGIYIYAVNPETLKMDLRKSVESEYEISCVTTAARKDVADYLAIFNNYGVLIQSVRHHEAEIDLVSLASYEYRGIINCVVAAKWNRACDKLVCGARDGSVIRIDLNEKELDKERISFQIIGKRCGKAARCSAWSHNKKYIAVGYDDARIRIWDVFHKRCIQVLYGHSDSIKCLAWSPNDQKLAAGSDDTNMTIWEKDKPNPNTIAIHQAPVNAMVWLDNEVLISAGDDTLLTVTNTTTGHTDRKQGHQKKIYSMSLSGNRKKLASCGNDKDILIWNTSSWGHKVVVNDAHKEPIRAVAWQDDVILTSSNDKTLKLWRVGPDRVKQIRALVGLKDFVYGASLSEDGKYAIGGCTDSTVGFWDVGNKNPLYISNDHMDFVWNVSVRKQHAATSSSDGTVRIWDMPEGDENRNFKTSAILEVIPESDIVGCDFRGAIMDGSLKNLIQANGGLVDQD